MRVYLGSDHAGYELKNHLVEWLKAAGHEPVDCGPLIYDAQDDYPPFCLRAAEKAAADPDALGIVIGGSGNGEQIAANKVKGVRAALAWRAPCGDCRSCRRGRPWYCFDSRNAAQPMTLADGTPLTSALGIGAFAEKTLVAAGQAVKVDPAARPEAAGLVGCGVMAGYGAAVNTGKVGRGDSVAVIGCGGVGNAAIAGACLNGAMKVIAVDIDDRKLDQAEKFGATHTVNSRGTDPVEAVRELTGGHGVDIAIDAVGRPETFLQAFSMRDHAGVLVLVGVPGPGTKVELPLVDVFSRGGAVKSSWYGDCLPSRDFPFLIDQYLYGLLDLNAFVSETITLDRVEEAFGRMRRGEVLRSVVVL
ncbi:RpiB/LacA/LacB family sugar-phosphate isomerase [Streptomyces sp. SID2955]|nr:RpiB/LacA/LacB family sugar-phosphate isomerase [Streptomyces sp. SID2955]